MRIVIKRKLSIFFIFVFFTSPVLASNSGSIDILGESDIGLMNISNSHYKKPEGSQSKNDNYNHKKKHSEGSKGRTWGRGRYEEKVHSLKKSEENGGMKHEVGHVGHNNHRKSKHGGHYKGYREGSHSERGYGSKNYSKHGNGRHGGHSHYSKDPFKHVLQFKRELGLTDTQVTEIKSQQFEYEKISIRSYASHKIAHMELDRIIHSENIDEVKARQLADKIAEAKTKKIKAMVEGKLAVMRILTPDQKRKISQMYNRHN